MTGAAIPPLDQALLPPQVRNGSASDKKAYTAALGFEQMLVQQLSQAISDTTSTDGLGGDASSGADGGNGLDGASAGDAASSPYASLLPDALTQGIMKAGGLGLAQQLAPALAAGAGGGTSS
jgi:Rod binding domain-containing protein